jgi:hypothetical protein
VHISNSFALLKTDSSSDEELSPKFEVSGPSSLDSKVSRIGKKTFADYDQEILAKSTKPKAIELNEFLKGSGKLSISPTPAKKSFEKATPDYSLKLNELFLIDKDDKNSTSTCFLLLKMLFIDIKMYSLPTSFYRAGYFLLGACLERALKIKSPSLKEHDLEKIVEKNFPGSSLTNSQIYLLKRFFQVYKFFLTIDTNSNPFIPSQILPKPNFSSISFDSFFQEFQDVLILLASLNDNQECLNGAQVKVITDSLHTFKRNCHNPSLIFQDWNALHSYIKNDINNNWPNPQKIDGESFDSLRTRFSRMEIQRCRLNYFSKEIREMLEIMGQMNFEKPQTISLPLLHHLVFCISSILEASLLALITLKPISSRDEVSAHIIFQTSKHYLNERPLGYEHNMTILLNTLPNDIKKNMDESIFLSLTYFSNFINCISKYPDKFIDEAGLQWYEMINQELVDEKNAKKNNHWLQQTAYCIHTAIRTSAFFISHILNFK